MPEIINPYEEFKEFLGEHTNYDWIDFGNGLLVTFTDDKANIRQYHDGMWLSSWVDKEEFLCAVNGIQTEKINLKEELDNE